MTIWNINTEPYTPAKETEKVIFEPHDAKVTGRLTIVPLFQQDMNIKLIYEGMKGVCRRYQVENAEFITVVLVKEDILKDEKFAAFDTNDGKMVELSCTYDGNSIETSIYKLDCHLHDEDIEKHVNTVVRKELEKRLRNQGDFKGAPQSVIDEMPNPYNTCQ